jgi:hypothetical protein
MWFKTRVGFAIVDGSMEILVAHDAKRKIRVIYASSPIGPRLTIRTFLVSDRGRVANYSTQLAFFKDDLDSNKRIAECMALIESAIRAEAKVCDLSESGDSEAWRWQSTRWKQVEWLMPT